MKILYLIRHAKAEWARSDQSDFDRPLSGQGESEARSIGSLLAARGIRPDLILTSPAVRALETAKIIAHEIDYNESAISTQRLIYEGDLSDWLQSIGQFEGAHKTVFFVGHNPTITDLLNVLTDVKIKSYPTCGAARVECDMSSWTDLKPGIGKLTSFDSPVLDG